MITIGEGRITIYLNGPKRTIVIMLRARQFSTQQKHVIILCIVEKILNQFTRNIKILMR